MEILLLLVSLIIFAYIAYVSLYALLYLFAFLSSPVYFVYKLFTEKGEKRKEYANALKGLLLAFLISYFILLIIK